MNFIQVQQENNWIKNFYSGRIKMDVNNFKTISLFGRIAYGVSCFENTITFLQYDVEDWKVVLKCFLTYNI